MIPSLPFDPAGPWVAVGIVLATFASEDLTCVAVGLLLAMGRVDWLPGLGGCLVGIVLGDLGVYLIGRLAGRGVMRWKWGRKLLSEDRLAAYSQTLCTVGGRAVVASRFVPGTRVPLLLAAGVIGSCPYRLMGWATFAAALWVPLLVLSAAVFGESATTALVVIGFVFVALRVGRNPKFLARVSVLWRWEFWPAWVFYLPLAPWYLWLSAKYRSFTVWTAANPGIPAGVVVGESKAEILGKLPAESVVPTTLIPAAGDFLPRPRFGGEGRGEGEWLRASETEDPLTLSPAKPGARGQIPTRLSLARAAADRFGYPLVLKPDAGQRGAGVKKIPDRTDLEKYLDANPDPIIAQPFHPGPFEAGVFYYRLPDEPTGRVFSITDKVFPVVVGDGTSTIEQLVWKHPRYRMQAATFLARHDGTHIPAAGDRFPLAVAGNHCQGTLFRDGEHLLTTELSAAFDRIAKSFDGFFVGRFDVRYADEAEFRAGRGFAVLELNGATSESTNLYDPSWSLLRAYRTLFRQWAILFRIGDANRRRGHRPISLRDLFTLLRDYYRTRTVSALAD